MIYHITSRIEWKAAIERGAYLAPSLASEGFIHCSTEKQVPHVANAFYRGKKGLVLLAIAEEKLKPELKWEAPAGPPAAGISTADKFPHVYGPLDLDSIVQTLDFEPDSDGKFSFPSQA